MCDSAPECSPHPRLAAKRQHKALGKTFRKSWRFKIWVWMRWDAEKTLGCFSTVKKNYKLLDGGKHSCTFPGDLQEGSSCSAGAEPSQKCATHPNRNRNSCWIKPHCSFISSFSNWKCVWIWYLWNYLMLSSIKKSVLVVKNNSEQKEFGLERHLLEKLSVQIIGEWILSWHHSHCSAKGTWKTKFTCRKNYGCEFPRRSEIPLLNMKDKA